VTQEAAGPVAPGTAEDDAGAHLGGLTRRRRPAEGLRPTVLFALVFALTVAWVGFAVWASDAWRHELEQAIGPVMAWVIPILLAYIPGLVIGFMIFTLLLSPYRELSLAPPAGGWPPVTVLIAARNEEAGIAATLQRLANLAYGGAVEVVLADNGSTDRTQALAEEAASRYGLRFRTVVEPEPGKHLALNTALATVTTPVVVTVDGDTYLQREALTYLIARLASSPQGQRVSACSAALVAHNPLTNFVTRMQQWDYRLGINGVKRTQASYNTALVAQGAFSAYRTDDLRAVGGWPDAIGEDIVLTWALLGSRGITQYEPVALGMTVVPEQLGRLLSQRSRWARGMLEGLTAHPPPRQPRVLAKLVASVDYLVPFLDVGVIFFWVPGVILFLLGYPLLFGWWSMLLIPITLAIFGFLRRWQERHVFRRLDIRVGKDVRGFLGYLFAYQVLTSAASLRGYGQYVGRRARRWK
jgi:biofilm PGA synthesis N-glycosyltransferase PgaC